jgi:glycosyltransferase involved in cell wall biosynthesis
VVIDGGSTDGTERVLRSWAARDPRVVVLVAPGTNISAGRNVGIANVSNGIVATTDAGCTLAPGWLDALRRAFAEPSPPGLVAGNCGIEWHTPLQHAQAIACYADQDESRAPSLFVRLYGRCFGQVFDPTLPFARSLAFTVEAWRDAGGFPEDLRWTEDGVFGRNVAAHHDCRFAADARVSWVQHPTLRATFKMYKQYGMGAAASGDRALVLRDFARMGAYGAGAGLLAIGGRRALPLLAAGGMLYFSLPLRRAARQRAGLRVAALVPVAMMTKDFGKVSGAVDTWLKEMSDR